MYEYEMNIKGQYLEEKIVNYRHDVGGVLMPVSLGRLSTLLRHWWSASTSGKACPNQAFHALNDFMRLSHVVSPEGLS